MRNLTIKRTKSYVACLGKMKVYIEDPASGEITISGVPCRKLGDLKNGEEKTFQVDCFAAKVFVIADKMSKTYCNEFYQLPEGQEDIFLSGKNKFNPTVGNPFRFDNNNTEAVIANRKRNTKKGVIITIVAALVGLVIGLLITSNLFSDNKDQKTPKTFTCDDMSITLTNQFIEVEAEGYNAAYGTKDVSVLVLKEDFTLLEGFEDYTTEQYLNLLIQNNNLSHQILKTPEGRAYIEYEATTASQTVLRYYAFAFKTDDAFWLIHFATTSKNADEYEQQIMEWAKTIEFASTNIVP